MVEKTREWDMSGEKQGEEETLKRVKSEEKGK